MSTEVALNYNMDLPDLGLTKDGKTKSEGIGILVDMAKAGKIDPWNIDIVDVRKCPSRRFPIYRTSARLHPQSRPQSTD